MPTQPPPLPVEIQILIIQNCTWTQHPTISRVCKLWKSIVSECSFLRYECILKHTPASLIQDYGDGRVLIHKAIRHIPPKWEFRGYTMHSLPSPQNLEEILPSDYSFFMEDPIFFWQNTTLPIRTYMWHIHTPFYHRADANPFTPGQQITLDEFWGAVIYTNKCVEDEFRVGKSIFCEWTEDGHNPRFHNGEVLWPFELSMSGNFNRTLLRELARRSDSMASILTRSRRGSE